jgi:hypothetical protein
MPTTNYGWVPPTVSGSSGTWGTLLNALIDEVDADLKTVDNQTKLLIDTPAAGATITLNLASLKRYFSVTPNQNFTFAFSNVPAAAGAYATAIMVKLVNSGGYTVTWPSSVKWPSGTAPTLSTAGTHLISLVTDDDGTTWRGNALTSLA